MSLPRVDKSRLGHFKKHFYRIKTTIRREFCRLTTMVSYKEVDSLPRRAAVIPVATQPCLP